MKKYLVLSVILLLTVTNAYSQNGGLFSAGFIIGMPQGEHKDANDELGFGFNLNGGYNFSNTPITVGLDANFFVMNSDTRNEKFSTTIPDVRVKVTTASNLLNTNLFLRFQPNLGIIQPYIEVLGGFNYLYTDTSIESENANDGKPIASSVDSDDFAFAYGAGAGLMVPVYTSLPDEDEDFSQILIQGGAKYMLGGDAEYIKEGDKKIIDGELSYDITKSKTDLLHVFIGVAVKF